MEQTDQDSLQLLIIPPKKYEVFSEVSDMDTGDKEF